MNLRTLASAVTLAVCVALPAAADTHAVTTGGGSSRARTSGSPPGRVHAVTTGPRTPGTSSSSVRFRSWRPYRYSRSYRPLWWAPAPVVVVGAPSSTLVQSEPEEPSYSETRLGVSAQVLGMQGRFGFGADLALEGRSLGFFLELAALPLGTAESGLLADASVGVTVASGDQGRLRVELGALSAVVPGMVAAAPGAGVSGALAVLGPVLLTGRVRGAVWPYLRAEAQAAAVLALGPVGLQAGYRAVYVRDLYGLASGVTHAFAGPFLGLELVL
jgi:hypothetical protein